MLNETEPRRQDQGRLIAEAAESIRKTQRYLLSIQRSDGHWCGELEGDSILSSEYVMAMMFLGMLPDPRVAKAAEFIRRKQLPEGGWAIYPGGPPEISASVKAYFVLKVLGDDPDAPHMAKARQVVLELGGVESCNTFTRLSLAMFGQYDWKKCPAVPPEIILLPRWFYINIYEISSWSRAIFVPLSIIWAHKPTIPVPEHGNIPELFTGREVRQKRSFWATIFFGLDRGLKLLEKLPIKPSRELALKRAERWVLERLEGSDGLGAIFPPIVNSIIALRCLGYPFDHPTIQSQIRELEKLEIEEEETLRVQPCFSPVWDTAIAMNALYESGLPPDHRDLQRAASWVLSRRGHGAGDWRVKNRDVERPGWYFEYSNPFYPDNDTTAKVLTALSKVRFDDEAMETQRHGALQEAHRWHLSMQNSDGGWAAFDRDNDKRLLTHVPFADHNAMIDPSNEDITGRVLETFSCLGRDRGFSPARRAIAFLGRAQEEDGSWFGRWGCNYLYGTWLALWGLRCIGEDMSAEPAHRGARWIRQCQNKDGGWGELPLSYDNEKHKGRGPSTPSQTAWALMGLLACGETDSGSVRRGVAYLLREQHQDGSWSEDYWTGTGFPGVFYLRYHLYGVYFPLMALAYFMQAQSEDRRRLEKSA